MKRNEKRLIIEEKLGLVSPLFCQQGSLINDFTQKDTYNFFILFFTVEHIIKWVKLVNNIYIYVKKRVMKRINKTIN